MDHLQIRKNEYSYKEKDRRLKEKYINGINDDDMMTEIEREQAAVKKTNEITSEQALCWAKRVEAQRAQKTILEPAKESKESDVVQRTDQEDQTMQNKVEKYPKTNACTAALYMSHTDAQHMASIMQDVAKLITLSEYAGAQAETCQEILAARSTEQFMTWAMMLRKQRYQQRIWTVKSKIFNFHSIRSVIIAKL